MKFNYKYIIIGLISTLMNSCVYINHDVTKPFGNYVIPIPEKAYSPEEVFGHNFEFHELYNDFIREHHIKSVFNFAFNYDTVTSNQDTIVNNDFSDTTDFKNAYKTYSYGIEGNILGIYYGSDSLNFNYNLLGQFTGTEENYGEFDETEYIYKNGFLCQKVREFGINSYSYKKNKLEYHIDKGVKYENKVSVEYENGQVVKDGKWEYVYDKKANLTNSIEYSSAQRKVKFIQINYTYDSNNRLIEKLWIPLSYRTMGRRRPLDDRLTKIEYLDNEILIEEFTVKGKPILETSTRYYQKSGLPKKLIKTKYKKRVPTSTVVYFYTYEFYE